MSGRRAALTTCALLPEGLLILVDPETTGLSTDTAGLSGHDLPVTDPTSNVDTTTPPEPSASTRPLPEERPPRPTRRDLAIGCVVLAVFAGVFFLQWRSATTDRDAAQAELDRIEEEANALPDVGEVVEEAFDDTDAVVSGDEESADVTILGFASPETFIALDTVLDDLGFSSATRSRISNTRSLDGTLDADGDHVNVTWTYHPDNGLQMVFELDA